MFDDDELIKEIAVLLREEKNSQVKCYIASDVKLRLDEDDPSDEDSFADKLTEKFKEEGVYLEDIECNKNFYSHARKGSSFFNLNFLPKEIQGFGSEWNSKVIFDTLSAFPYSFSFNYTTELFSKYYNLFEVGSSSKNWEEFAIWIRRQLADPNINISQWLMTNFLKIIRRLGIKGLIPIIPGTESEEPEFVYPDQKIADNFKKVVKQFLDANVKQKPYLEMYLKTCGNELGYLSLNGIFSFLTKQYHWLSNQNIEESLRKGITYNSTRSLRVLEGYYHVPTMAGLPLTWSTNFTYILSPRVTVDAVTSTGERTENFDIRYSESFSMTSRMTLELPTVTQVGVQINSSGHAALEYVFTLTHSDAKYLHEITLQRPSSDQKYFEYYRVNQQIQHDQYEDLPDWDAERKNEEWCSSELSNEITGVRMCRRLSYPLLPLEKRLSTFLSGPITSSYVVEPYDRDLHYYKLTIIRPPTNKNEYDVKIRFKAPGTKYSRELSVDVQLDTVKREGTLKVAAADLPDFVISASRTSFHNEDGVETGAEQHWLIQLTKDKKYELKHVYNEETKQEARHRRSSRNKEFLATNRERTIDLETPHNKYHWSSKAHIHKDALKVEALITYENLEDSWNWGASIFPKTLWETDKKAWLQYEGEWEVDFDRTTPDHFHRHMVSTLKSPKRTTQILTHRMHMPARVQLYANATVTDAETGKYLTFLNCSYNIWKNKDGKKLHDIHSGRIEIPFYTWTTHLERDISDEERFVTLTLARTRLRPQNEEGRIYRGGLDQAQRDNFDIEEMAAKYVGRIQFKKVENQLLPQKLLEVEHFRNKNERFPGIESKFDLSLTFPFDGKDESITIKGDGIGLYKEIPTKFSINWLDTEGSEMTMVGHSTVSNMKREIHTVTGSRHNWIKKLIIHRDSIYHNDERKTEYNLNLLWGEKQKCEYLDLKHSFTSSFYEFDSDVLLECEAQTKAYRLEMNINTKSPEWDVLNSKTHQIFYLQRHLEGYEIMNFTNPYLKVDAEGKIGMDFEGPFYDKKYSIKSQNDIIPSAEITYNTKFSATPFSETVLLAPEEGLKKATWRTDLARDGSGLTLTGKHIHVDSPDEEHQHSSVTLKFLSPYKFTIKGYEDLRVTWAVAEWIQGRLDVIHEKIAAITRNNDHPVMRLFRSLVEPYEKWEKMLGKMHEETIRSRIEIHQILHPFIEPTVEFLENVERLRTEAADHVEDNYEVYSLSTHLAERYRIQTRVEEFIIALPHILLELLKSYIATQDNHILKFEYTGNHLVRWPSLFEAPETWEGTWRMPAFRYLPYLNKEILFSQRYMVMPYHKTAMIFGPLHIYTFDGKFYEFIDYPIPDCTYMLAHDVRDSSFSIITSSNKLHLMFPEITLTLVSDGKIYVNNSRQQSATPIESYNGKVTVTREGTIVAVDSMGIKVVCDVPRMFCIFVLDSFHHSGTMGLLGNADGEAFNDFSLPDGKHVETSAEMARGYEVSNRKKCRNVQEKEKPEWTRDVKARCSSQFTKELTNCAAYLEIDENDFKEACRWDVSKEMDVCFSVDALAGYCTVHGMKSTPCSSKPNWYLKNVRPVQKLEVVLVIDEHATMFPKGLEGLVSLLGAVEEEFIENGYNSILYSVIGFGGKGVRANPHIETPDAYIWHNQKETVSGMKQTLQFNGNSRADAFDAIKYAATILPFDLESSRIMLLFTVDDYNSYFSGLKVAYLEGLLGSYSLTLYTFADFPSIDKGKKVFGLTADGVIFPKGRKAESYIDLPTTEKAKLTTATHGAIFLRRFAEANEPYAFFKIAAEEFAAKVKKEASKCRNCFWTLNHWWDVQNQCHVTDECRDQ